jgi:membrane associated rhomboid family serine protease
MLIPIGHENASARRWPIVTIAIIVINVAVFVVLHGAMEEEGQRLAEVKLHLLMLAAMHPQLDIPPGAQNYVATFREHNPKQWGRMESPLRDLEDAWDVRIRLMDDVGPLQAEMNSLGHQYEQLAASCITERFAFIPAQPRPIAYLTANFLHGGWLHLIGNMWFLWLAGVVLEDVWGRVLYSVFYLMAGAAALQFWAWLNPGSMTPTLGASGAIAALMGAFLIRFPKSRIRMMWILFIRPYRFAAPAYALLPLWLLKEVFYASLLGETSSVANWAHVGGFLFGVLAAVSLRYSGLEHKASEVLEAKLNPVAPAITEAAGLLQENRVPEAVAVLKNHLATQPEAVDAWAMLQEAYWNAGNLREDDLPAYREATLKLCELHLRAREYEPTWRYYGNLLNVSGQLPAPTWLALCRLSEDKQEFNRALEEYQKLVSSYPSSRESLLAELGAARISLKRLNRPTEALKFYQAASASSVPHLDWEQNIAAGIREAKAALTAD